MKFFLIGIKGSGMAALASLLDDQGYEVSGSDVFHKCLTDEKLLERGIHIYKLDDKEYLKYDVIVIGHNFYKESLIDELKENKKIYFEYHKFLSFYLNNSKLISICGSHGKTTLVNLFSLLDNSYSYLRGDGEGKMVDYSEFFFLESCEYKNHFLEYHPQEIIITNIDYDHVDFFKSKKEYEIAFNLFSNNSKKVYINYKDRKKIKHKNVITFGKSENADYYYRIFEEDNEYLYVSFYKKKELIIDLQIKNYGENFVGLITSLIAFICEHNLSKIGLENKLKKYEPASQRFEELNMKDNIIILDYAHHPKQIENNYQIVSKKYKNYVKIAVFRGDRFSRIFHFKKEIKKALYKYDYAYILPLANMEENVGKDSKILVDRKIKYIDNIEELKLEKISNKKYSISLMSSKPFSYEIEYLNKLF